MHDYSLSYSGGGQHSNGQPQYVRLGTGSTPSAQTETTEEDYDGAARAVKRARLVWTPQLHKRFEEAVAKLGPEKSIPKNIMQVGASIPPNTSQCHPWVKLLNGGLYACVFRR